MPKTYFDEDRRPVLASNIYGQQIDSPVSIAPGGLNELSQLMVTVADFADACRLARSRYYACGMPSTFGTIFGMSGPTDMEQHFPRPHVPIIVPASRNQRGQEFAHAKEICRKTGQIVFALTALERRELPAHHPLHDHGKTDDMVYRFRVLVPFLKSFKSKKGKIYAVWTVRTIESVDQISAQKSGSDQEKRLFVTLVRGAGKELKALQKLMPGLAMPKPPKKSKKKQPTPHMDSQLSFLSSAI